MDPSERRTATSNLREVVRHPGWIGAYLVGGRRRLLTRVVADSIAAVRRAPIAPDLATALREPPVTPLGRLGAPQEYLYRIVRCLHPRTIVETGVYRGISTSFLLAGLADAGGGRLVSIDLPDHRYATPGGTDASPFGRGETTGYTIPVELRGAWRLEVGPTRSLLPRVLAELGSIDLFLHDSEHTAETMAWEYRTALPYLPPGGVIASDDVDWNSAFDDLLRERPFAYSHVVGGRLGIAVLPRDPAPPGVAGAGAVGSDP